MSTQVKKLDIFLALASIGFVSLMLMQYPTQTSSFVGQVQTGAMNVLSPFFLLLGFAILMYSFYLAFSRHGAVRMGEEKPEYSFLTWFIMIFCTGMGSNLLYWSAHEWMFYYQTPPMGIEPFSEKAAEWAVAYGPFHWGVTGWAIYGIGAVTLGLKLFCSDKPGLSLSEGCARGVPFMSRGWMARAIELCFLFGTVGGFVTMLSFVVPMYTNNLSILFGWENTFTTQVVFMLVVTVIFTCSSWSGLSRGIRSLSQLNVMLAMLILVIVFIFGPTNFIIKSFTNTAGLTSQNFIMMSLWTDFVGNSGFPESWTAFYWAWWIGLAPSVWIFAARISRGRTVREMILGIIFGGSLGCWLYFGVISNFGMYHQLHGMDFVGILNEQGSTAAVSELVLTLPGGKWMLALWTLTGVVFLVTTLDSGSYTLALSTTLNSSMQESEGRGLRLFWSLILLAIPLGLMYAKAPMATLQASAVLTSVPIALITIVVMYSGYLYLRDIDYKPVVRSRGTGKHP